MAEDPKEIRVKMNHKHVWLTGVSAGLMQAVDALEELPDNQRLTPGFALALNVLRAKAHEERAGVVGKHLAAVGRAGHDVGHYKSISVDPNKAELVCEFYDPDLFDKESF